MTDLEKEKIFLLAHSIGKMARELQSIKRLLKEIADTSQTERIKTLDYCDIYNHKGCDNCIANNLDDYCVPSGYTSKDTPQTDCETCRHYKLACELFSEVCKYESTTQTETQNSNSEFKKRTMRDCYNCKRYESEEECVECKFEPNDTPQTEPQTDCEIVLDPSFAELSDEQFAEAMKLIEPQTDCAWK